jgi:hypothetical protein
MPQLPGQRGAFYIRLNAVPENPAGIGASHPIDDFHEGRLARPVLAQHGVDLPGLHAQVDGVIGNNGRIPLGDLF